MKAFSVFGGIPWIENPENDIRICMLAREKAILKILTKSYDALKQDSAHDAKSESVASLIAKLSTSSLDFLSSCKKILLHSMIPGKEYFSFAMRGRREKLSRAVNRALFKTNEAEGLSHLVNGTLAELPLSEREQLLYTVAISYCCAADLLKTGDQKTPATFFECLIGHLIARTLGINPTKSVEVLRLEEEQESGSLPTDLIYDLGRGKPKLHVPVKTSTRERVIQVFAHQRLLDGVHGFGSFRGILVALAETKLNHTTKEVIEICVPKQWNLYHRFIAPMHRFYYFDLPRKYEALAKGDPPMAVSSFARFFDEANDLAAGR